MCLYVQNDVHMHALNTDFQSSMMYKEIVLLETSLGFH